MSGKKYRVISTGADFRLKDDPMPGEPYHLFDVGTIVSHVFTLPDVEGSTVYYVQGIIGKDKGIGQYVPAQMLEPVEEKVEA